MVSLAILYGVMDGNEYNNPNIITQNNFLTNLADVVIDLQ